jgi:hypothetical protein
MRATLASRRYAAATTADGTLPARACLAPASSLGLRRATPFALRAW